MPQRPLIIIHGWSDNAESFQHLADLIEQELQTKPKLVDLANYISMDDAVKYSDLITAMDRAWDTEKLPRDKRSVDVIVHSTGGLLIRDWLSHYFKPTESPIYHLVMLAPANFGSPLAHKGRAFIGRIIKGLNKQKLFQVGDQLLKGLEIASPFSWKLAMRDRFGDDSFYEKDRTLCSVFIGNTGYDGIAAAANEPGSDGTVRVSTANMNCHYLGIDFMHDLNKPKLSMQSSQGQTAFGIIDGENHSTIVAKQHGPHNKQTLDHIIKALTIDDKDFADWCEQLATNNKTLAEQVSRTPYKNQFINAVFRVKDQFDNEIDSYFLEFGDDNTSHSLFTKIFHEDIIRSVHEFTNNPCYRSLYIDSSRLYKNSDKIKDSFRLQLQASPDISTNKNVGYHSIDNDDIGGYLSPADQIESLLKPNTTLLVDIRIKRLQGENLFTLQNSEK